MGTVAKRLEQVDKEIAALKAKVDAAWEAYTRASAATGQAALALLESPDDAKLQLLHDWAKEDERQALERHEKLEKEKEQLQGGMRALVAKLPRGGERTLPSKCQRHHAVLTLPFGL